jgi:hypothetical protein
LPAHLGASVEVDDPEPATDTAPLRAPKDNPFETEPTEEVRTPPMHVTDHAARPWTATRRTGVWVAVAVACIAGGIGFAQRASRPDEPVGTRVPAAAAADDDPTTDVAAPSPISPAEQPSRPEAPDRLVEIVSDPPRATIEVDGVTSTERTPTSLPLRGGQVVVVRADGHHAVTRRVMENERRIDVALRRIGPLSQPSAKIRSGRERTKKVLW